ncbi:MAG: DUF3179 domain-containing protein [Alkalibacterium sp.]|nr:DUF3179 domain-containing protein [Alkalibacterium sp.]
MKIRKDQLTLVLIVLALIVGVVYFIWNDRQIEEEGEAVRQDDVQEILFDLNSMTDERLDAYNNTIQSGGVPQDGIPSIDNPVYQSMADAEALMDNQDVVFIVEAEE